MTFSSLIFLCVFLPITFCLHCLIPSIRIRNLLLLIASLVFYGFGEPVYVFLMLFSSFFNYACARLMDGRNKRVILIVAVIINIGLLCVFKYTGFICSTINSSLGFSIPVPQIALPIGISFFTFQALSYVIDVYRGQVEVQKSFPKVLLYISFFPQLIAGPIVKYRDVAKEIENRSVEILEVAPGLRRFIIGLAKKILIANTMAVVADNVFGSSVSNVNILTAWIGAVAYVMQIYFDFSGYSDMAIGMGRMFGFHFKENFNYPYISTSVKDFWKRWHISLSSWFKDYVYIPLGGNRKGRLMTGVNKVIVFFLTGLWHGANWTFVVWGMFHGFFSFLEELVPAIRKLPKFIGHVYLMVVVTVGFVFFRSDTIGDGLKLIGKMFTGFDFSVGNMSFAAEQLTPFFLVMMAIAILACGPIQALLGAMKKNNGALAFESSRFLEASSYVLSFVMLVWCILRLSGGSYNPFIYFRF